MTELTKDLLDELKESIEECECDDGFCENFGCSTVSPLIHGIERRHEVLGAVLKGINDGHISAGEDFILKVNFLVKELEP